MQDPFQISYKDIVDTLKRHKKTVFFWSLVIPIILLSYVLTRPVQYQAEGSFREKGKSQTDGTKGVGLALLAGLNENNENTAISLFNSRALLHEAILAQAKQAEVKENNLSLPWVKNVYRNLQTEYALLLDKPYPLLADSNLPFAIEGLKYISESPLKLKLTFLSDRVYQIQISGENPLSGEVRKPFQHAKFALTIIPTDHALIGRSFNITLNPLPVAYAKVKQKLFVKSDNRDKGLLRVYFQDQNRHVASNFLNAVLASYQDHLRKDHERICQEQLAYLHGRQMEAGIFLEEMMVRHAKTMGIEGPTIDLLFQNSQGYLQKLLAIDLELNRLHSALKDGRVFYDSLVLEGGSSGVINQLLAEMRSLKQNGEAIRSSLRNQQEPEIRKKESQEYQGIDLASAGQLFLDYSARLNETEGEIHHHQFLAEQLDTPDFELSSLSSVLKDPVSHEIIQKASHANLLLQDQNNRSGKEQERLKIELALQKGVLKTHIEQTKELLQLKKGLLQQKIWGLQQAQLDLIEQKVAVLELQLQDYLVARIANLKQERGVIEKEQARLKEEMLKLPAKWASEKMVEQHLETSKKMIEKIAEAIEAKNISSKLDLSQSAPLDAAIPPMHPKSPLLSLFAIMGAMLGFCLSFGVILMRQSQQGFPARGDNLKLQGQVYLGRLNNPLPQVLNDSDLETLRKAVTSIQKYQVIPLLLNHGPNYAAQLAELLSKGGRKVVVLSCMFDGSEAGDHEIGLLHYLKGERLHVQTFFNYSWISSGGFTRFGKEELAQGRFQELLGQLKQDFDYILLPSRCPILSAEGETFAELADRVLVTLNGESLPTLAPLYKFHPVFLETA